MIFGVGFMFSCLAIMFFLHFRRVRSGEDSLIRRWVNAAGEVGTVEKWIEADSFVVRLANETVTVRLNAVDTPEASFPGGKEAIDFTRSLVAGEPVRVLEFRRNEAGEVIGEVYNSENQSLNEALMLSGWAWYYEPDSPNNPRYRILQEKAVAEKLGLWALGEPIPPWQTTPRNTAP